MSPRARILFPAVLALGGCALLTDLDGLSGGGSPTDDGSADSSPSVDSGPSDATAGGSDAEAGVAADGGDSGDASTTDVVAQCTTATATSRPTEGATAGAPAWSSPMNATAADGLNASVTMPGSSDSGALLVREFGFSIPGTARIDGVTVTVRRSRGATATAIRDREVTLTGVSASDDNKRSGDWAAGSVDAIYGGPGERWGAVLTPAVVNAPSFGVQFRVKNDSAGSGDALVDVISITIAYCN